MIQRLVDHLLSRFNNQIESVFLKGSQTIPEATDIWSDIDLVVVSQQKKTIDLQELTKHIEEIGPIVGKEVFPDPNQATIRMVLEMESDIIMVDLVIFSQKQWLAQSIEEGQNHTLLHGKKTLPSNTKRPIQPSFLYDLKNIDDVWFIYFLCINKFMRNDHLIGMHLLLRLIQEGLVLEMIKRDLETGTRIHRFGQSEVLPEALDISQLDYQDKEQVLLFIRKTGFWYDLTLSKLNPYYKSRYSALAKYIQKSLENLKCIN
ncbi:MAG: hypothetical protein KDE26_21025 [Bacteroidetes bacterium]|nr:hypothetical protein [Bacteroidota bacterium]